MQIIITDTARIWNHENPILEQYREVVLVVCLEGKPVSGQYECFVSPYRQIGMGIDKFGTEDQKYIALESAADALNRRLDYHSDTLFLTDGNPESLYPFYVLKDRNETSRLHLCAMSPWSFEGGRRINAHKKLLSDLSRLRSFLYIDSDQYLSGLDRHDTMKELMQMASEDYAGLLPRILSGIRKLKGISYFDFASKAYVPVREGFQGIDLAQAAQEPPIENVPLSREVCMLGSVVPPDYPKSDDRTKEEIERVHTRIDGKKICDYLRQLRIELARANGIEFISEECPSLGPCAGTCVKCDREAAYLRDRLAGIPASKRVVPTFQLTEWEVM